MIGATIRRAALGEFPLGTPLAILAADPAPWTELVQARNDPAVALVALGDAMHIPDRPYVLFEGIDAFDEPLVVLARLRAAAPRARLFALVANAAHITALGGFFNGVPLARAHPYTGADIEPLLAGAGWKPLGLSPLADETLPPASAAPLALTVGAIAFNCFDAATLERGRIAAYLAVADAG